MSEFPELTYNMPEYKIFSSILTTPYTYGSLKYNSTSHLALLTYDKYTILFTNKGMIAFEDNWNKGNGMANLTCLHTYNYD